MMCSISPRCGAEKLCARDGAGSISRAAVAAAASRRGVMVIGFFLCDGLVSGGSLGQAAGIERLEAGDVVGLDPARRTDGETRLGAGGDLARGLVVAADEGGLGGGEVGLREVAFAAIRHREIVIAVG